MTKDEFEKIYQNAYKKACNKYRPTNLNEAKEFSKSVTKSVNHYIFQFHLSSLSYDEIYNLILCHKLDKINNKINHDVLMDLLVDHTNDKNY